MPISKLSYVEIDRYAIEENIKNLKNILNPGTVFAPVIKSNAYGHGFHQILDILYEQKIRTLCVAFIEEALIVKEKYPDIHVICLGYVEMNDLKIAIEKGIELTVFNIDTLKRLSCESIKADKKSLVHLKLETGTNRQGFQENQVDDVIAILKIHKNLELKGVSTHYANIEDTTEHLYAKEQLKKFIELSEKIKTSINSNFYLHTACSAAAILFPKTHFNLARIGISLYGLWPSKETYLSAQIIGKEIDLKPVLSWKVKISQIKTIPSGSYIGYGCSYKTTSRSTLVYLPIGYYDGYDRLLSNKGWVLIKGERAPVRGRVCMNVTIVDVTNIPGVQLEDEAVLIGRQGKENISIETLAAQCSTINYEFVTRINPLIRRIII